MSPRIAGALLAALLSCLPARPQQPAPRRIAPASKPTRRIALVIGNSLYPKAPLKNPRNDADAMAATLRDLGFEVTLLKDLTLARMDEAIDRFTASSRSADMAILYFSGHGLQVNQENYLLPVDFAATSGADVKYRAYSAAHARDKMEEDGGARVRIMILDACRDNPFRTTRGVSGGLVPMSSSLDGTLIAYATADGQTAEDNPAEANGLYTKFLVQELRRSGGDLRAIFQKTTDEVFAASSHRQHPYVYDGLTEEAYLRQPPPSAPGASGAPADMEHTAYDIARNAHTRAAFDAFLKEFPNSDLAKLARIEMAGLGAPVSSTPASPSGDELDAEGRRLHAGLRYADEAALYRRAADAGDARGMADLGNMYLNGEGVAKDLSEALRLIRKAADAGDPRGQARLAGMYAQGAAGLSKDFVEALRLARQSADAGNDSGQTMMGLIYRNGWGVDRNFEEADRWYRKAAEGGSNAALYDLGLQYARGEGVAQDPSEALRWFRKAADAGNLGGVFQVGLAYDNGVGVPADKAEAARWYRRAADAGHPYAMDSLGVLYAKGDGVPKDQPEAARWFRMAADLGLPNAAKNLAVSYENGFGVPKDPQAALSWYKKAADQGNEDAKKAVDRLNQAAAVPVWRLALNQSTYHLEINGTRLFVRPLDGGIAANLTVSVRKNVRQATGIWTSGNNAGFLEIGLGPNPANARELPAMIIIPNNQGDNSCGSRTAALLANSAAELQQQRDPCQIVNTSLIRVE
jgi:TPR repeat protein